MKVLVFALAMFMGQASWADLTWELNELDVRYELDIRNNRQIIYFNGQMYTEEQYLGFERLVKELQPEIPVVLVLNSNGGNAGYFNRIFSSIQSTCKSQVTAVVPKASKCSSACFYLYLAAQSRCADPSAEFGFHAGRSAIDGRIYSVEESVEYLVRWGLDPQIAKKLADEENALSSLKATFLSPERLKQMGFVHEICESI